MALIITYHIYILRYINTSDILSLWQQPKETYAKTTTLDTIKDEPMRSLTQIYVGFTSPHAYHTEVYAYANKLVASLYIYI